MGRQAKGAKGKAKANRPSASRPPTAEDSRVRELEKRLAESLEREKATGEILRVISHSPTDVQPVFDAVAESAARLCESFDSAIWLRDSDRLLVVAHHGPIRETRQLPLVRGTAVGRTVLERHAVHVADMQTKTDDFPEGSENARRMGFRTALCVPLIREGGAIGAIALRRTEVRLFTDRQVALLQTFADQAVIAIENVRLFTELQQKNEALTQAHAQVSEALEQQTATADILRTISTSPSDVRPVLDAVVQAAASFCDAPNVMLARADGAVLRLVAGVGPFVEDAVRRAGGLEQVVVPIDRSSVFGRSAVEKRTLHVADLAAEPEEEYPTGKALQSQFGHRTMMSTPLLRDGVAVGIIGLFRYEVRPFSEKQISRLAAFADQAVIAIENVRLFEELEARTQDLTRSVDELTALGEVSRALSSTLNLETVLQTIVLRANDLAKTAGCTIWEYDQAREEFRLRASDYPDETDAASLQGVDRVTTIRAGVGVTTQVMERREPVQVHDIAVEGAAEENPIRRRLIEAGHHALLGVPLLSEDEVIGVLAVTRKSPGEFEPETVRLLSTFATQSALAIQNARLFLEIEDKSRQLEVASQHKSEFLANMSHELRTPLNAILGFSEVLAEGMFGEVNDKQAEYLRDIQDSGRHLLSLINDILDLSKVEAGRMELEPDDFDLPTAIDNAFTLVRERAGRRGIVLERRINARVGIIRGDERKVKQVLLNLLSNAIKFTPEGGRIDVRATVEGGLVQVSVADTGVGIAPEDQETVFEEFRQVGTADKKVEGTGLGLALSRKLVELHGGRICLTSKVGEGSTFTFTLPVGAVTA